MFKLKGKVCAFRGVKQKMRNFIIKNYIYLSLGFIALAFTVLSAFGLGNFSAPSTYYQTGEIDRESYYNSLCYEIDFEDKKYSLDSVWINLGSKDYTEDVSEIVIFASAANSDTMRFYSLAAFENYNKDVENSSAAPNSDESVKVGDWQVLCRKPSAYKNYKYFLLSTKNKVKINELAFVGITESGSRAKLNVSAVGAGGKINYAGSDSPLSKSGEFPQDDTAKVLAGKLIDEQSKFDINKIDFDTYAYNDDCKITEYESYTLESVRNLTSGRGIMLDTTANPLGQYLIAAGVAVFGGTSFGLRIVPFIFALLSLFTVYFIGKLMTGKPAYGLIFAFLFAAGGYSLFFATVAKVDAIFAFFILYAFYSVFKFVRKGISGGALKKGFLNIISGGAAFAAAFSVKSTAIFYLLPLIAVFAFGVVKQYLYAKNKGEQENDRKE